MNLTKWEWWALKTRYPTRKGEWWATRAITKVRPYIAPSFNVLPVGYYLEPCLIKRNTAGVPSSN